MAAYPVDWATNPEKLPALPGPYEMFQPRPGLAVTMNVVKWELGRTDIQPRDGRPAKTIPALRLWLKPGDKLTAPGYWDCTSKHLIAAALPFLADPNHSHRFKITLRGSGPAARPEFEALPR